jgi:molecular chaperone DnaK
MPQVEVTFDIDANGILHVQAKDRATGKEQKVRIEASSGLSDAEIDKMVEDAEQHAQEDEERRDKVEARNQLDSLVYQVEKDSGEWGEKVGDETKQRLDDALSKAKETLKGDDPQAMNTARDELMQAFSAAGQEMYQAQAAEAGAEGMGAEGMGAEGMGAEPGGAGFQADGADAQATADASTEDEDVVEADYEIVDEEK